MSEWRSCSFQVNGDNMFLFLQYNKVNISLSYYFIYKVM